MVSKKTARKAYIRNRLKRRVMEALRVRLRIKNGYDLLVMARPKSTGMCYSELESQLLTLFRDAKLVG